MKRDRKDKKERGAGRRETSEINLSDLPEGARLAVQPVRKDPNLRRVSVSGKLVAVLSASTVQSLDISEDTRWSVGLGQKIADALHAERARQIAMKLLSRRGLSSAEVRQRLIKRGHPEAVSQKVVADLESSGWISEKAVAESVVRESARKGPASEQFVRRKLRDRGVKADVAANAASSDAAPASGIAEAESFARKRLAKMDAELKPATKARRIARALAGRGFDDEMISAVLNRIDLAGIDNNE
jgi:regulatory protein